MVTLRDHRQGLLLLAVIVMLGGCASQRTPAPVEATSAGAWRPADAATPAGARIADIALSMVGTPYRYGGTTPAGFDCSGLVYFAYSRIGVPVPRTAREQRRAATPVSAQTLRRGDLLFFDTGWKAGHVGIYVGDQQFV